jgi:hypothetical protein
MYAESNICYPMYLVLECYSKLINVLTYTSISNKPFDYSAFFSYLR